MGDYLLKEALTPDAGRYPPLALDGKTRTLPAAG